MSICEAWEDCPNCGGTHASAVEIGHIFKLGYKYSQSMGAPSSGQEWQGRSPIMGSSASGSSTNAAVEQDNDENGFWLPLQYRISKS